MVRIITRGEGDGWMGELSDPVINRTNPSTPGSQPSQLVMEEIKDSEAKISWQPPLLANGPIDLYKINIEETLKNRWVRTDRDRRMSRRMSNTTDTMQTFRNLKAYTEYRVTIVGCNKLTVDMKDTTEHMTCSDQEAESIFRTEAGKPNRPNELKVTFKNSSIVELRWDKDFQLGAPEAEWWDLAVSRVGQQWENNPKRTIKMVKGFAQTYTMDLSKVQEDEDWSPDCENVTASTITNMFNFSIRAVVKNEEGEVLTGEWSKPRTVPAFCQTIQPIILIIGICIPVTLAVFIISTVVWKSYKWIQRKKEFFDKIGRELDDKFVVPSSNERNDVGKTPKGYDETGFIGRNDNKRWRSDSEGSMKGLLNNDTRETHESGRGSDTTSGCDCESAQSSEMGDRETGSRECEEQDQEEEEPGVDPSELPLVSPNSAPPSGGGLWLGPGSGHYTRCVPEPTPNIGYSKVGSLPVPDYVNQTQSTPTASEPPFAGYVTFNSVKSADPESLPPPGYITVDQLPTQAKEPSPGLESKEPPLSSQTIPQGYSRVGLGPTTPGYVAWTTPTSVDPVKSSPLSLDSDKDGDPLLITARNLACREMASRMNETGGVSSMV